MLKAYINSFKIPELRNRIIFTLAILALCRVAAGIPCPGLDPGGLNELFESMREGAGGGFLNIFNLFSGGALERFAVAALGIMPYITASIVMQLLIPVVPALEKLRREGESGTQKINKYTRYLTLIVCIVHGTAATQFMMNPGALIQQAQGIEVVRSPGPIFQITTVIFLTAGTMLLVWLGEQISDRGLGNGVSLIITINILSGLPGAVTGLVSLARGGGAGGGNIIYVLLLLVMFFAVCAATVALTQGQRKIPIRHAKRSSRGGAAQGQTSYLPLRVNYSGVMPIIFGSAILMFPTMVFRYIPFTQGWAKYFQPQSLTYIITFGVIIVLFSFFWVATQFKPTQIAQNLQKQGGYIPGIRPGKPTASFLDTTMTRITFAGSLFLTGIAIMPMVLAREFNIPMTVASFFGGTSLLIMVSVILDTMRQVEAFLLSHRYDGFLEKGRLRSRSG